MIYYCNCGNKYTNKGQLIQHCALLTDGWPAKSIWNNPEHHPIDKAEYLNRQYRILNPKEE